MRLRRIVTIAFSIVDDFRRFDERGFESSTTLIASSTIRDDPYWDRRRLFPVIDAWRSTIRLRRSEVVDDCTTTIRDDPCGNRRRLRRRFVVTHTGIVDDLSKPSRPGNRRFVYDLLDLRRSQPIDDSSRLGRQSSATTHHPRIVSTGFGSSTIQSIHDSSRLGRQSWTTLAYSSASIY